MFKLNELDVLIGQISKSLCKFLDLIWEGLPDSARSGRVISRVVVYYFEDLCSIGYMNYNFFYSSRLGDESAVLDSSSILIAFMKVYHTYVRYYMMPNRRLN
jgi:hypothetical protein